MTLALMLLACAGKSTDLPTPPDTHGTLPAAEVVAPSTPTEVVNGMPNEELPSDRPVPVPEIQQVQLGVGETATLDGWSGAPDLKLWVEVTKIEDGRCPRGVTCVWEGNAAVTATVKHGEEAQTFTLHTAPKMGPDYVDTGLGVAVNLTGVVPYPSATAKQSAPRAELTLSELR